MRPPPNWVRVTEASSAAPASSGDRTEGRRAGWLRPATAVGSGIFLSRITGFARDIAVAAFLGTNLLADAYFAAIKIPNIIRNLLGEGTLSAAFVPVYSEALERDGANAPAPARLATSVLGLVLTAALFLSALGVILAPWITDAVMVGADDETRRITTELVRILFPMSGTLIVGAWFLGVLNSHGKFFLPFVAPTLWNLSQIAGLLLAHALGSEKLAHALAWSALVGSLLQVGIQLPAARRLVGTLRPSGGWSWEPVRRVARNTVPVISSQGIFQISTLVDISLATLVGTSAMSALGYSQRLMYLPISLFGISVAAAALPDMSREATVARLRPRLVNGFFQILFFVLPAAVCFLVFGDLIVRLAFERRAFTETSTLIVAAVLGTYALGLVASASQKLFASGFHALQDTRTPMIIAAVAVTVGIGLAVTFTLLARAGLPTEYRPYAAMGIALGGACGAWINLLLLWTLLGRRLGGLFDRRALRAAVRLAGAAGLAGLTAALVRSGLASRWPATGFLANLGLLLLLMACGAVPYLLIARRPPVILPQEEAGLER
ncbi:MAG: murein biosynthesis integral membrane protein MurJ [marine benthic group bacterium]|nr:murein biosynthesis integral membrane protein MurJ [Candidatus Benthicola marisminoris]